MPLSKYHLSTTKDRPAATQSRVNDCSSDLFTMPDHEFAELLWENGQIVMQGHSNRSKESSFPTTFPSHAARVQEKEGGRDAGDPKASQFHAMDPMFDGFSPSGPSVHIGANAPQDDDMVPWINYPIDQEPLPDDTLQQNDYFSGFLNEFPGASLNSPPSYNNPMATVRSSGLGQDIRNWHNVEHGHASKAIKESSEPSRVKTSQFFQSSQHCQSSAPNSISRAIDAGISDSTRTHSSQNQNIPTSPRPPQLNGGGVLNFPHFSRPALLAKANLQLRSNEKASALSNSNTEESTLIESASVFKSATGVQGLAASVPPPKMGLQSSVRPRREVISVEQQPEAICRQDALRKNNLDVPTNNNCSNKPPDQLASSSVVASVSVTRRHEAQKAPEAVVASSSSVCSVNSAGAGAASNDDPKQREKRKSRQGEESGYPSEEDFEFEDGSVELRKPATGRGTSAKSSRAAEVHNLSERRRRDRINEKMRALQELIPNCNKADKASMLEEAIEYLKTLQMQVQIMSMSTGLCMPPMLLPPGMQPMHAPAMVRFSPMGVLGMGMGVGFGYGMGMYDMHGSPRSCSMFPLLPPPPPPPPPMHGPQLPCPSSSIPIPGPLLGLHGMPGPANRRMFGNPGQGVPLPMPRPSSFGSCSGLSFKANSVPGITAPTANCLIPASDAAAPTTISHDQQQQQNIDLESLHG